MYATRQNSALVDSVTARKILVIRPRKIGDMVLMTPLLRTLRQAYPTGTIVVLAQPPCDQVLTGNPNIDAVWLYPNDGDLRAYVALARRVRRMRFDIVLDAFGTPATARLTRISRAARRVGLHLRGRAWAYTDTVAPPPSGTYAAVAQSGLLEPLGYTVEDTATEMFPSTEDQDYAARVVTDLGVDEDRPLIAIAPAAAQLNKTWSAGNFARMADALVQRWGAQILFVHGRNEARIAQSVRDAMRSRALPSYPETRTLTQLAALLARCTLFIGNDSGTRHIAIAMGVPTVGVFGRSRPSSWTPPKAALHRTVTYDPGCKSRCVYPKCKSMPCITEITTQSVLALAEALLLPAHDHGSHWDTTGAGAFPGPEWAASAD